MKAVGEVAKVNCRRCILPCNRDRSALVCWHGNKRKGIRPCQRTNNLSYPGKPVIAGTRITVEIILEKLAAGETPEQILGLKAPCH